VSSPKAHRFTWLCRVSNRALLVGFPGPAFALTFRPTCGFPGSLPIPRLPDRASSLLIHSTRPCDQARLSDIPVLLLPKTFRPPHGSLQLAPHRPAHQYTDLRSPPIRSTQSVRQSMLRSLTLWPRHNLGYWTSSRGSQRFYVLLALFSSLLSQATLIRSARPCDRASPVGSSIPV
jgi:hypothetical protein